MTLGYTSSLEHLLAELERLDLLLRVQVWRLRQRQDGEQPLATFYIPDREVDALLAKPIGAPAWAEVALPDDAAERIQAELDRRSGAISDGVAAALDRGVSLRLVALAHRFGLDRFDVDVLLICLGPELDRSYERLYAYVQDDMTRTEPSVGLILDLLCPDLAAKVAARARFAGSAPLAAARLVQFGEAPSLLASSVRLDPRVAAFLLDGDELDGRVQAVARLVAPSVRLGDLVFPSAFTTRLERLTRLAPAASTDLVLYFQGPSGVGKASTAEACCAAWDTGLLVVDGAQVATRPVDEFAELVRLIDREARLQDAVVCWEGFDALLDDGHAAHLARLLATVNAHPGPTFLCGDQPWEPADALGDVTFVRLAFPEPSHDQRVRLWQAALDGDAGTPEELAALAGMFRLTGGQIRDAAATARDRAYARDPDAPRVTAEDLRAACRLRSNRKLGELARKIVPSRSWDELVLPADRMDQLREVHDHVRYRALVHEAWGFGRKLALGRGLNVLLAGPPGTGKTMAADVLAGALGLDLYAIDLSRIVSKYVGETEKNLARIFAEARTSNAILFFDEADALFGKRTQVRDAHDRYANVEVSYLLQKMEEHEGVVILATNLRKNMDEAFVRRLHFTIEFPHPGVDDRRRIWERIWPADTPRDPGLDLGLLAREVDVAGGGIRNIAVASAFLAAAGEGVVTMAHVMRATQREYQKVGKVLLGVDGSS